MGHLAVDRARLVRAAVSRPPSSFAAESDTAASYLESIRAVRRTTSALNWPTFDRSRPLSWLTAA